MCVCTCVRVRAVCVMSDVRTLLDSVTCVIFATCVMHNTHVRSGV